MHTIEDYKIAFNNACKVCETLNKGMTEEREMKEELLEALEETHNWFVATVLPTMRQQEKDIWYKEIGKRNLDLIIKAKGNG